jgi:hypothetical protein
MASTSVLTVLAEHGHKLPADPIVIGLTSFVLLLLMMVALLMFGKGRPHS